jgi:hypothetical protein
MIPEPRRTPPNLVMTSGTPGSSIGGRDRATGCQRPLTPACFVVVPNAAAVSGFNQYEHPAAKASKAAWVFALQIK